jgi:hypothetical protein
MSAHDLATASDKLRRFAAACADRSPLYAHCSTRAAEDAEVAGVLLAAPTVQLAHPTLLFAAVHALVLDGRAPELAAWYPSVGGDRHLDEDPWPTFRRTVLDARDRIAARLASHRTQTNEVGRSTPLLVAMSAVAERHGELAWLDVGASAGLNLRLDRFRHELVGDDDRVVVGPDDAAVRLRCDVGRLPQQPTLPPLVWRQGLDAAPVDVTDAGQRAWLEACVWPEQTDRLARLRAALATAADHPLPVRRGDAVADLAAHAADAPADATLLVTHTWVLAYLDTDARAGFEAALDALAADRPVVRIGMEGGGVVPGTERDPASGSWLVQSTWHTRREDRTIAAVDDHGRWLRWQA